MKRGDLVKHPGGIRNVCEDMYAMGIVLQVKYPQNPPGEAQVEVLWRGKQSRLVYHSSQLEVISENR
jgi:hypothetical protein